MKKKLIYSIHRQFLCVTLMNENRAIHRKAGSILLEITLVSFFGTLLRHQPDIEKASGLSLIVPTPILHNSRVSKIDQRAIR
jgi:hypothetical protein